MPVFDCLCCGLATERHDTVEASVQDEFEPEVVRDGLFDACVGCGAIDVDVYSEEGWQIELRARDVAERGRLQ